MMRELETYCPRQELSDILLFEILAYPSFDSRTGAFNASQLEKCYLNQMRHFHPDKEGQFAPEYKYTREEATTIAAYIEQAYRLLTTDESFQDYLEQGREAWTGKEWAKPRGDGSYFAFSGYSDHNFNWEEADEVLRRMEELNTSIETTHKQSATNDETMERESPDQSFLESESLDISVTEQVDEADTDKNSTASEPKKRRRSSKRASISSFAESNISKILDHRKRANSELKFQVIVEGMEEAGAIWITSIEMQQYHVEALIEYLVHLRKTNQRKHKGILRMDATLIKFLKK